MNEVRPLNITITKAKPPAVLYKYFPPERVSVIESEEVHFSSPSTLNDVFDTHPLLPRATDWKVEWERSRSRNQIGVLCLTGDPNNHLMWVNYARSHTGFVIGFDAASPFFEESGRALRKVEYPVQPPVFQDGDENGCFYKSPEWEYEEEWRCVRRFGKDEFGKDESRTAPIEWQMVKEIIFGHRIEASLISRIVRYATLRADGEEKSMPLLFSSAPMRREWRFMKKPQNYTMCKKCGGDGYLDSPMKGD